MTTKKKPAIQRLQAFQYGAAGRNRTHDPLVRSQVLYPAELQPLIIDAMAERESAKIAFAVVLGGLNCI